MAAVNSALGPARPLEVLYETRLREAGIDGEIIYGDPSLFNVWKERTIRDLTNDSTNCPGLIPLLERLGRSRHEIAREMGTPDAENFGALCYTHLDKGRKLWTSLIARRYWGANEKIRQTFFDAITKNQIGVFLVDKPYSRYKIERVGQKEVREKFHEILNKGTAVIIEQPADADLLDCFDDVAEVVMKMKIPGVNIPEKPTVGPYKIGDLEFLVGTVEGKIGGEWKILTRHIIWLNRPIWKKGVLDEKSFQTFRDYGFGALLHAPRREVKGNLEHLDKLTRKLFDQKYTDPRELARDLGFWEHRLFSLAPYSRGSASVIEVMRAAICARQGLEVPKRTDLDALVEPDVLTYTCLP